MKHQYFDVQNANKNIITHTVRIVIKKKIHTVKKKPKKLQKRRYKCKKKYHKLKKN